MLRRGQAYRPAALTYGDLTLDPATGDLSCGDKTVRLGGPGVSDHGAVSPRPPPGVLR